MNEAAALSTERELAVRISVCTLCSDRRRGGMRTGRWLLADLVAAARDTTIEVVPIACMSVCQPSIALTFAADGKWTHMFSVPSDTDPKIVLECARHYARSYNGLFVWDRCEVMQKGVVARLPPPR